MCLSETFTDSNSALELVVTALNINHELPQLLLEKCRYLEQQDKAICASYEDGRDDGISEGIESVAVNIIQYGEPIKKILEFTKLL